MAKAKSPKVNWDSLDTNIEFEGKAIKLPSDPENMPLRKALEALARKIDDEEQAYKAHEIIDAYPHDAAVAFVKACRNLYGFSSPISEMTFFGEKPPTMIAVKTGFRDEDVVQVAVGKFKLPGVDEPIHTTFHSIKDQPCFVIYGQIKKRDRHIIVNLANETRRLVKEESIYKGKAIRLGVNCDGNLNMEEPPTFLDVTDISESSVLFDDYIQDQINVNLLVPMKTTEACRYHKIPLKRGVLLEGQYGTGKSLTARLVAHIAERFGWTFVLLDKVQGLRAALEFAKRYEPAVVFAEDIDRIATERDEAANDLINVIDGVVSKNSEIMTVLTTNFVEQLNPVILRPGRLDAVISLKAPSAETVERLIRHYAGKLVDDMSDLTKAGQEMAGQIPASIRECVERAKLSMVGRGDVKLNGQDLVIAAHTMKAHLALLNRKVQEETLGDKLVGALREVTSHREHQGSNGHDLLEELANTTDRTELNVQRIKRALHA